VIVTSYAALTERRYDRVNGVPGELLAKHSLGQTFVARYPELSGVELWLGTYASGAGPLKATVVLHLRSAPSGGPDLATVRLPAGSLVSENPWYLFSFPPIADSQDRAFYVEMESPDGKPGCAVTFFWWESAGGSDPYAYGSAFLDRRAQKADLAFGLHYSDSPLQAWAQMARAATAQFPAGLQIVLLLAGLAGAAWAVVHLPVLLRDREQGARWASRWSLVLALGIGLAHGVIYMLLVPPWQGPDEQSHFAYAALLYRHGLDNGVVEKLDLWGKDRDTALEKAIATSMDRHNYTRWVSWDASPGSPADPGLLSYQETRQSPAYYWLCAAAIGVGRAAGLPVDPYANPDGALLVVRVVSVVLTLAVVALAWLAAALLGARMRAGGLLVLVVLPLTVALLPMHAFIAAMANNDILAEVSVSSLFVALIALLRRPDGLGGAALALLAVFLTGTSALTKSTALAASIPLLGLGLVVWGGMLVTRRARRASLAIPATICAGLVMLSAAVPLLAYEPQEAAAGWQISYWPVRHVPRVPDASAHTGSYVFVLRAPGNAASGFEMLLPPLYHPALDIVFSAWARSSPAQGSSAATASISVIDGSRKAGGQEAMLPATGDWTPLTATAHLPESANAATLQISSSAGAVEFDDLSLKTSSPSGPWDDPVYAPRLLNASAEEAALGIRPWMSTALPAELRQIADAIANPQPFDKPALWRSYADGQFRSFWGIFGYLSVPLPDFVLFVLGSLSIVALCGLGWVAIRTLGNWSFRTWLCVVSFVSLVAAILTGFAQQMMLLADSGIAAYPQGRYLFVLSIPITLLLMAGAWFGFSLLMRLGFRALAAGPGSGSKSWDSAPRTMAVWAAWLWVNGLVVFAAYCILSLAGPYYYGL
jgi:hypothetical protein